MTAQPPATRPAGKALPPALAPDRPFDIIRNEAGDWIVKVPWGDHAISVRRVHSRSETEQAFELIYRVYVDERGLISPDQLPMDQAALRRKWDDFDFATTTCHLVAVDAGRVVGCLRIVEDVNGVVPLDLNGYSLASEREGGRRFREISKLIIDPAYRGRLLLDAFYWQIFRLCRAEAGLDALFLSCGPAMERLYAGMRAVPVGAFLNAEFGREYSVMRIDLVDSYREQVDGHRKERRLGGVRRQEPDAGSTGIDLAPSEILKAARRAAGCDTLDLAAWSCDPVHGGGGAASGGVYRVHGVGTAGTRSVPWSFVCKLVTPLGGSDNPAHFSFWKREPMAYAAGALSNLPSGLATPRYFGEREVPHGTILFLEDVREVPPQRWTPERFAFAARTLGEWNGSYLASEPLPAGDWVSHGWLRGYVEAATSGIGMIPNVLSHPLASRVYSREHSERVLSLWEERRAFLEALDDLPRTFSHLDALRRNLLIRRSPSGGPELVALDWANAGIAPVGQDISALVLGSVLLFDAEPEDIELLEQLVLAAYIQGLGEAGWRGEEDAVRFGYAASAALRYLAYGAVRLNVVLDERLHAWAERVTGHPVPEIVERNAAVQRHALRLACEARDLVSSPRYRSASGRARELST